MHEAEADRLLVSPEDEKSVLDDDDQAFYATYKQDDARNRMLVRIGLLALVGVVLALLVTASEVREHFPYVSTDSDAEYLFS